MGFEPAFSNTGSANLNIAIAAGTPAIGLGGSRGDQRGYPDEWADIPAMMRTAEHVALLGIALGFGRAGTVKCYQSYWRSTRCLLAGLCSLFSAASWLPRPRHPGAQVEEIEIKGTWLMEERVRSSAAFKYIVARPANLHRATSVRMGLTRYSPVSRRTPFPVAGPRFSRPGCVGRDRVHPTTDAMEGIGVLVGNKFYIDWVDEAWIDDVLTIADNRMTGHDGNAPLDFVKID